MPNGNLATALKGAFQTNLETSPASPAQSLHQADATARRIYPDNKNRCTNYARAKVDIVPRNNPGPFGK
jgi:hypothetical protein